MLEKKFAVEKVQVRSPTSPGQAAGVIPKYPTGSFEDYRIPFPRTCGARFCSTALSDLIAYVAPPQSPWIRSQASSYAPMFYGSSTHSSSEGVSISSFYVEKTAKPRHQRHHQSQSLYNKSYRLRDSLDIGKRVGAGTDRDSERSSRRQQKVGLIKIYDTTCINPVSRDLAERYKLDLNDVQGTCEHNAGVARELSRMDLAQVWQLVGIMSDPSIQPVPNADRGPPFAYSAFGRPLLKRIMEHYGRMRDVQTMAMLCCIFWDKHPSHGHRDSYVLDLHAEPGTSGSTAVTHLSRNDSRTSLEYNAAAAANVRVLVYLVLFLICCNFNFYEQCWTYKSAQCPYL
ncbi:WD repeat-containing protein 59 [Elysia marginata]|uniref:WD repeat-containing protein 59 n=1 Tax=Elysia marginata TaxID=1093978 RepID=A0AAV4I025_9GAST|nr:WD repeat-containing protein 59 [Elysia marginata]